ncbi:hypothetical protein O6H91_07G086700 [Diphasiastrum complanatum]|uniref:Uncharacterized protein n=2 Tax=Diphasiastrum complanatum TaxID=34168 RepID=A0ACC2D773_DIPCM|nr:hypothetical protein O6H91_07G084500 [Diphasiastrum complanatum]KAJ7550177.1 hypothetical protein O6H91_07G086700 [Diphasiastrum complanatum]
MDKQTKRLLRLNGTSGNSKMPPQSTCISEFHVLAVDDSTIDRKVIERLLKISSCKVTTVSSALRACEILGIVDGQSSVTFNEIKVNLIMTDYCMPDMTGYDLLKKVKESAALKEIPVVIMSSENVPNRIERCLEEGAKEFIIKPVRLADIKRLSGHVIESQLSDGEVPGCSKRKSEMEDTQNWKRADTKAFSKGDWHPLNKD